MFQVTHRDQSQFRNLWYLIFEILSRKDVNTLHVDPYRGHKL